MSQPQATTQTPQSGNGRWRFTYLLLGLAVVLLVIALANRAWRKQQTHDANLPVSGLAAVAAALRTFHQQTGRFPQDFRELDARLWRGAKQAQISPDGKSLTAPAAHYYYTLHVSNPPPGVKSAGPPKAGLWAVPTGPRAPEAATHFWYFTPTTLERWQGPALTAANVGAMRTVPSEQQLALLPMTRQTEPLPASKPAGVFSFLF